MSGARKLTTFANCLNPASPILIVEGSVYTRNILSFVPAEDIDQIILSFTYRGLKHTGPHIVLIIQKCKISSSYLWS